IGLIQFSANHFQILSRAFLIGLGLLVLAGSVILLRRRRHSATASRPTPAAIPVKHKFPETLLPEPRLASASTPALTIKIDLVRFRSEYLLNYRLISKPQDAALRKLLPAGGGEQTPYPIKEMKIRRLEQLLDRVWQNYNHYISTGEFSFYKPLVVLQEIGEKLYHYFGLTGLLDHLFQLPETLHLTLQLQDLLIPWHWAFHPTQQKFLCEKFPLSFMRHAEPDETKALTKMRGPSESTLPPEAIIFYGDWKGYPQELKQVHTEIQDLTALFNQVNMKTHLVYQDCDQFAETIRALHRKNRNLRLIHYSGHIEQNMLALSENEYFSVHFLKQNYRLNFATNPLIFLNGCRSGALGDAAWREPNLAHEFINCGAPACVVTHFPVPELMARNFALRFYAHLIQNRSTIGQALLCARADLAQAAFTGGRNPEYDVTRYFYHLYGDPTVRIFL
ncbi:CHAT domain-containing protein, partial [candidate division KSB1 bacterium]|nr:CHAT domain-containing protein [candidate division KSB1 bacterium]